MGVAAYQRGDKLISRQYEVERAGRNERDLVRAINATPHNGDPRRFRHHADLFAWSMIAPQCPRDRMLFLTTVGPLDRLDQYDPTALDRMERGTSLFYSSLREIRADCRLALLGRHDYAARDGGWHVWHWLSEDFLHP